MAEELMEADPDDSTVEMIGAELATGSSSKRPRIGEKVFLAASEATPSNGGVIASAVAIPRDEADTKADDLRTKWLEAHERKLITLREELDAIHARFESLGPDIEERIQSPEYLGVVRQAFRVWDQAETEEK